MWDCWQILSSENWICPVSRASFPALLPWRTVRANARLLLDLNRSANGDTAHGRTVDELLADVGLADFEALADELELALANTKLAISAEDELQTRLSRLTADYDSIREFFPNQQPPRPMAPPAEEPAGEYPHTLDLRRPRD